MHTLLCGEKKFEDRPFFHFHFHLIECTSKPMLKSYLWLDDKIWVKCVQGKSVYRLYPCCFIQLWYITYLYRKKKIKMLNDEMLKNLVSKLKSQYIYMFAFMCCPHRKMTQISNLLNWIYIHRCCIFLLRTYICTLRRPIQLEIRVHFAALQLQYVLLSFPNFKI